MGTVDVEVNVEVESVLVEEVIAVEKELEVRVLEVKVLGAVEAVEIGLEEDGAV